MPEQRICSKGGCRPKRFAKMFSVYNCIALGLCSYSIECSLEDFSILCFLHFHAFTIFLENCNLTGFPITSPEDKFPEHFFLSPFPWCLPGSVDGPSGTLKGRRWNAFGSTRNNKRKRGFRSHDFVFWTNKCAGCVCVCDQNERVFFFDELYVSRRLLVNVDWNHLPQDLLAHSSDPKKPASKRVLLNSIQMQEITSGLTAHASLARHSPSGVYFAAKALLTKKFVWVLPWTIWILYSPITSLRIL